LINKTNQKKLGLLCRKLILGEPQGDPVPVAGGFLHKIWRVQTDKGLFAIKELNPIVIESPIVQDEYRLSERISGMFAEKGVPAVSALKIQGEALHDIESARFLVFQWIEGETLKTGTKDLHCAQEMGKVLGRIHQANVNVPEMKPAQQTQGLPFEKWRGFLSQAKREEVSWSSSLESSFNDIERWNEEIKRTESSKNRRRLVSHGDLDQKNVLWKGREPYLIDWEGAGWTDPEWEITDLALNWSGLNSGDIDWGIFREVLKSYGEVMGPATVDAGSAIWPCVGTWLLWLEHNMRRSLDKNGRPKQEQELAAEEVKKTLKLLNYLVSVKDDLKREIQNAGYH
jgi:Ser/Thr protein kinase RdoA (MazF antagonist)